MKIGVICGSHRRESQSEKVGRYAARQLEDAGLAQEVFVFSLAGNPLPFWDAGLWSDDARGGALDELRSQLRGCDGFVVVSPEWHGMVPSGLKNFFLLMPGAGELAHKPALIISVSAGAGGGAYPVAELRMSSYKNNRICYLPEHLIVRHAGQVFNEERAENDPEMHAHLDARLTYCLEMLREYALAFRTIRASGKTGLDVYKNGM